MTESSVVDALSPKQLQVPTYFEKLIGKPRLGLWVWLLAGALATGSVLSTYRIGPQPPLLGTFPLLGLGMGLVPLAMTGVYKEVISWLRNTRDFMVATEVDQPDAPHWINGEMWLFSNSNVPLGFGAAFALLAFSAFWFGGAFRDLAIVPSLLAGSVLLLSSFVCGIGVAGVFYLGRIMWRAGKRYEVIVVGHAFGILSTGRTLVKCYFWIALVWCVYAGSATWSLTGAWIPQVALALPTFLFFVGSFVFCQLPLHNRMVELKRSRLLELQSLSRQSEPHLATDMSDSRLRQCDWCVSEIERVSRWPEWPFSLRSLTGVFGAALGAVAPHILPFIVPFIRG